MSFLSPNGDGVKDAVTFGINAPATGIEKWSLVIVDAKGTARRTFAGTLSVPGTVVWDGKDDAGAVLPEGGYTAKLDVLYVNGNNPKAESPVITIDVTAPTAAAKAEYDVFSPNGDGNKDVVTLFQDTSEEVFWTGTVKDAARKEVRTMVWRGRADAKWAWDGRGDTGTPLVDGPYAYTLATTDRAGNTGTSQTIAIRIDTSETPVRVSTDAEYFSPNADGMKDRLRIIPSLRVTTGVDAYTVRIRNAKGDAVRTFTGRNRAPEETPWDGLDQAGGRSPDGRYTAELEVVYANGNKPLVVSNPFFIDTRIPQIDVRADALLFSPDADSRLAAIAIRQTSSEEDLWEGEIRDSKGAKVRDMVLEGQGGGLLVGRQGRERQQGTRRVLRVRREDAEPGRDLGGEGAAGNPGRHPADPRVPDRLVQRVLAQRRRGARRHHLQHRGHPEGRGEVLEAVGCKCHGRRAERGHGHLCRSRERRVGREGQGRVPGRPRGHLRGHPPGGVREGQRGRGEERTVRAGRDGPEGGHQLRGAAVLARQRRGER